MKKFGKILLVLIVIFTLFWCVAIYYIVHNQNSIKKQFAVKNNVYNLDKPLPQFSGTTLIGNKFIKSSDYFSNPATAKPMVINIWASWCEPCKEEMPIFNNIAQTDPKITVLGINIRDTRVNAVNFLKSLNIAYPNIDDTSGEITKILAQEINFYSVPITILVDSDGKIKVVLYESLFSQGKLNQILREYIKSNAFINSAKP